MWEYLSTSSQSIQADPLAYRVDFADYIVALAERSAAMGFVRRSTTAIFFNDRSGFSVQVQGLDPTGYRSALKRLQTEIDRQIRYRLESLEKYKSSNHRHRRMSIMAPKNSRGLALDFEQRIAICKRR